jgi:hypothetical protein
VSLATGLNRGRVTRVTSEGLYVQIPGLYGQSEIGPLDCLTLTLRRPARSTASANGPDAHTHSLAQVDTVADRYLPGDRVLVADVDPGDWIVVGRIQTGVPS